MSPEDLLTESRLLLQLLKQWSDRLHAGGPVTNPMRSVLERLLRSGPVTVPAVARALGVTRQHVQLQVDALLDAGMVLREPNPAHKRSSLIALADKGRAVIESMRAEERRAFARLQTGVSDEAMADAAQVLAACRAALVADRG